MHIIIVIIYNKLFSTYGILMIIMRSTRTILNVIMLFYACQDLFYMLLYNLY
jgi:hypothetical protein